jgi:hypothetical protein
MGAFDAPQTVTPATRLPVHSMVVPIVNVTDPVATPCDPVTEAWYETRLPTITAPGATLAVVVEASPVGCALADALSIVTQRPAPSAAPKTARLLLLNIAPASPGP